MSMKDKDVRIGSLVVIPSYDRAEDQFGIVLGRYGHPSYQDFWILIGDERDIFCVDEFEMLNEGKMNE